ncbi:MAG: sigma-70 family RNA polymerase sigma factor [Gemmataceae bacterium]|nr:sigma-70 family RNA polymerase sigma factor [Gemmataceae bacterium]
MYTTSISLLERLSQRSYSPEAWSDFVTLYTPLLHSWASRLGVPQSDVGDLVQEVFLILLRKLPEFRYIEGPCGSFRGWLRTVLVNKWRELNRRKALPVDHISAANEATVDDWVEEFTEQEYRQELMRQALLMMQQEFQPQTWQACWQHVILGRAANEVATELGTTAGAVRVASSRVLARLRQLLRGFLD